MSNHREVVVTGIGAVTAIGNSADEYWAGLKEGRSGAAPITLFDASNFKTQFACEVKDLDLSIRMNPRDARRLDRFATLALYATAEAVEQAGISEENIDPFRSGVIYASGIGGLKSLQDEISGFATGGGTPRYNPFLIPKMIVDIVPGHISIKYGLKGPNFSTVSACASSTHAIGLAADYIRMGKADLIITGGSEAAVCETGIGGFNAMRALSTRNDDPAAASRPFDKERDGFVLGEGAGTLILESREHAEARGAEILAVYGGSAATADSHHITAPHPEGEGAMRVMQLAIEDAGLQANEIDYINVHGTSTPLGDIAEAKAILRVFGEAAYDLSISSTKSMTGHLLGAAGAIEAIACIQALRHQVVPPTINHSTVDPDIDPKLDLTLNQAKSREIKAALSNTFGFGGHNASVIFKRP